MRAANLIALALIALLILPACRDEELERENMRLTRDLRDVRTLLFRQQTDFKKDLEDLKAQRHQLRGEFNQCRTDLAEAVRRGEQEASGAQESREEAKHLLKENDELARQCSALNGALVHAKSAVRQEQEEAVARGELVERLQKRLDESEVAAADAVRREDNCESERTRLANRLLEAEERNAALERSLAETTEKLEAARAKLDALRRLVPDAPGPTARKSLDAIVTAVKTDLNLLTLSVGTDDGVKVGDEFTVYRGNEYVAKVVVDRVEADHCTVHSKKDIEKSPIQVGDSATTKF